MLAASLIGKFRLPVPMDGNAIDSSRWLSLSSKHRVIDFCRI